MLEVKRGGLIGASSIGGCSLNVTDIVRMNDTWLPLYSYDSRPREVGKLKVSIEPLVAQSGPSSIPRGLVNRAGTGDLGVLSPGGGESNPAPVVSTMGSWSAHGERPQQRSSSSMGAVPGGLINHADLGSNSLDAPSSYSAMPLPTGTGGLVNYAEGSHSDQPIGSALRPAGSFERPSFARQGTTGLANLAAERGDGKRPNALPRVLELLEALADFSPSEEDHRTKLAQALEELRHVPDSDLQGRKGQSAYSTCSKLIGAIFDHAIFRKDKREMDGALWLAGRLPSSEEEAQLTLQDKLRQRWDRVQMDEALERAKSLLHSAAKSGEALEKLMDALDLAEFHANFAGPHDSPDEVSKILADLQPQLRAHLDDCVRSRRIEQGETLLSILGDARIETLELRGQQQDLQRLQGLELLRSALQPLPSQVGFPPLKDRQLRHATTVCKTAMADDPSGVTAKSIRALLLEMIPSAFQHSNESVVALLRTAFILQQTARGSDQLSSNVWSAAQGPYESLSTARKADLAAELTRRCKEWGQVAPGWLLSRELVDCQLALRSALRSDDPSELQQACKQVMNTQGGREVCQLDMRQALTRLQQAYRLPEGWTVEHMIGGKEQALLQKVNLDPAITQMFDRLLKETNMPAVRTRDRRGAVPKNYHAVKAIEVRNAANWATYTARRDEIARECRNSRGRTDDAYWRDNLNGLVLTASGIDWSARIAERTTQPTLMREANEVWMIHGTNPAAADGISSTDFDMARASPSGLFGAGIYFAESVSKSDEYAKGKTEGGREIFPLLICRVCLGNIYYCAERGPDRRQLEARCLGVSGERKWHSVLGDRKKTSGTFREFIVYDNEQAFPAYIVWYTREY